MGLGSCEAPQASCSSCDSRATTPRRAVAWAARAEPIYSKSGRCSVCVRAPLRARSRWASAALSALLVTHVASARAAECARPTDPDGAGGYDYGTAKVSSFGNDQVLVWYTTQGEHAVK